MRKAGFTLIELVVVVTTIGILASVAVPNYRGVIMKAEATALVADATTVAKAAYSYQAESGSLPRNRPWGRTPPELESHLPGGFSFDRGDLATMRWRRWIVRGNGRRAQRLSRRGITGTTVGLQIRSDNQELIRALKEVWTGPSFGNRRKITLLFQGGA